MALPLPFRYLFSAGEGLLDRLLCVSGAILFSQLPEFIQQYLQRLGGHLDEARRQLAQFEGVARQSNLTLDQFIEKTSANTEPSVARLGEVMHQTVLRVQDLTSSEIAIRNASLFARPFVFLQHMDGSIAHATWSVFQPAVPTTIEGLLYAGIGVILMLGVYHGGVKFPLQHAFRKRTLQRSREVESVASRS
ncbi:MAG TPA: DUF2937 family protein [Opitutaceae bacterium]|nr:DUF2937 family protein [Opitutaceae bacterium]